MNGDESSSGNDITVVISRNDIPEIGCVRRSCMSQIDLIEYSDFLTLVAVCRTEDEIIRVSSGDGSRKGRAREGRRDREGLGLGLPQCKMKPQGF
jgi:hypothetical protein